jgi:ABC-2 type transport system permease protein
MRQQMAYKIEGVIGMGSTVIWFVLYLGIWSALLHNDPAALLTQFIYIIGMRLLSEFNLIPTWELQDKFRQGDIALELIKPIPLPLRTMADYFGRALFAVLRALPVYIVAWIVLKLPAPTWDRLGLFLISALFSHLITTAGLLSLSLISLWTTQFDEAENIWSLLVTLFSGALVPLHYLPDWAAAVARVLPFSGIYYTPSAILSGTLQGGALWQALGWQIGWAVVLCSAVGLIWCAGSRKLTVQGG